MYYVTYALFISIKFSIALTLSGRPSVEKVRKCTNFKFESISDLPVSRQTRKAGAQRNQKFSIDLHPQLNGSLPIRVAICVEYFVKSFKIAQWKIDLRRNIEGPHK